MKIHSIELKFLIIPSQRHHSNTHPVLGIILGIAPFKNILKQNFKKSSTLKSQYENFISHGILQLLIHFLISKWQSLIQSKVIDYNFQSVSVYKPVSLIQCRNGRNILALPVASLPTTPTNKLVEVDAS